MSRDRSDFGSSQSDERMCSHHPEHDSILDFPIGCKIGCLVVIALVIIGMFVWGGYIFGGGR
jgi:hypothetical protein